MLRPLEASVVVKSGAELHLYQTGVKFAPKIEYLLKFLEQSDRGGKLVPLLRNAHLRRKEDADIELRSLYSIHHHSNVFGHPHEDKSAGLYWEG